MFVNIKVYDDQNSLIYEVNPYHEAAGTLKGLPNYTYSDPLGVLPPPDPLGVNEVYVDELVYEMHPSSSLTEETESFHFVLGDGRYKDNRIPPQGFDITKAVERVSVPVWHGVEDPNYFTAEEYTGGYDDVSLTVAAGAAAVEIRLFYQTTSREYIEFLRDEINGTATTLTGTGAGGDLPYVVQSDPFFTGLKAWGDTIWQLWSHNMNVPGAKPFLMTQGTVGSTGGGCTLGAPTITDALPGHMQVTLNWTGVTGAMGYNVYYDQAGKLQPVANAGDTTTYTDTGLTNGQQYCYAITAYDAACESAASNTVCATPTNVMNAGVSLVETGLYQGKGGNVTFNPIQTFTAGDEIFVRAYVVDDSGAPLAGATVDLAISGPESLALTTGQSDANGMAEASWKTSAPRGKQTGTAAGSYTVSASGITLDGYVWDGVATSATFTIQ